MNIQRVAHLLRQLADELATDDAHHDEQVNTADLQPAAPASEPIKPIKKARKAAVRLGPALPADRRDNLGDDDVRAARRRARELGLVR